MATQTPSLTYEQYRALPDSDEFRHTELIDGVLVHKFAQPHLGAIVVNAASRKHNRALGNLFSALRDWTRTAQGRGEAAIEQTVRIDDRNALIPDVLWYPEDRRPPDDEEFEGPAALVVEVSSPSTRRRDRTRKLADYTQVGVEEVWLVDADVPAVTVYRRPNPDAATLDLVAELREGDDLTSPLLPGFSLRLDALLQR